jgi:Protein of unknown function (DUF1569)
MKSICNPDDLGRIRARIMELRPDSPRQWGLMTAAQAQAHMADQLRLAKGDIQAKDVSTFMSRTLVKWLVLAGMPAPKGKVKTMQELDQQVGGTPPGDFEADKAALLAIIAWFVSMAEGHRFAPHAFFGQMTKAQWGKLAHSHLNHHLSQFGV